MKKSNSGTYLVVGLIALALFVWFRRRKGKDEPPAIPVASAPSPPPPSTWRIQATTLPVKSGGTATATWVKRGRSIGIDGRTISGGFFYFGSSLKKANNNWANENCLVDPAQEVSKGRADVSGQYMSYWPSYSDIAPSSRKAFLDWLGGARSDPNTHIGYVFLYFYGLERRVMLDAACDDAAEVIAEVRRLLEVYGSNGSFRRYASALLEAYDLKKSGFKDIDGFEFDVDSGELPLSVRAALGLRARDGKPIEPELLLAYTMAHPETRPRTPARRAYRLLKTLFVDEVRSTYPNGFLLKSRKKLSDLEMKYRAASNSFEVPVLSGNLRVPDVMELEAPLASPRKILEDCTERLDAYSRELGKSEGMKPTLAAVAKLPSGLRVSEATKLTPNPIEVLNRFASSGQPATVDVLARQIGHGPLAEPNRGKLSQLSMILGAFGFGWTADPAFSLRGGKSEPTAVVFRLDQPLSVAATASEAYLHTRMLLQIGMIIANADGVLEEPEKVRLRTIADEAKGLSMEERKRLQADLVVSEGDKGSISDWTKRLKEAPVERRREIGAQVAHIAQADGVIGRDEVVQLEKLFKIMELDQRELYQQLHGSSVIQPANDDMPVTIIPAGQVDIGSAIPAPPAATKKTAIDLAKLAGIRSETQNTASILGDIFRDEAGNDDEGTPVDASPEMPDSEDGLDGRHRAFLRELLTRPEWARPDFDGLARRLGLMPSAATETINDWAYDRFDDLLISGDDPLHVELTLIPESEFGEAA